MDQEQRKSYLLNKYINNTCTQAEFDEFLEEVKTSQNFDGFDDAMQQQWQQASSKELSHNTDWDGMHSNIVLRLWALKKSRLKLKYAAAIALVVCASAVFFNYKASHKPVVTYLSAYAAPAQTKVVLLADGSKITLNSNSSLRYPQSFDGEKREVYLTGEAYFEVAHKADKPFVIHSGKLTTNVLGTSFTVSAYSQKQPMNVTVLTGKVAVKDENSKALEVLTRGHWATSKPGSTAFETGILATPEDAIAWIDNKLIFDNTRIEDVAQQLTNKFGLIIKVEDSKLGNQRISGIFQSRSLDDILAAITTLTHSRYGIEHNNYVIKY